MSELVNEWVSERGSKSVSQSVSESVCLFASSVGISSPMGYQLENPVKSQGCLSQPIVSYCMNHTNAA